MKTNLQKLKIGQQTHDMELLSAQITAVKKEISIAEQQADFEQQIRENEEKISVLKLQLQEELAKLKICKDLANQRTFSLQTS